jgi:hypothetical protein
MKAAIPNLLFSGVLLTVALAACATAPLTLNDNLVVPGERIGEVEIGMPLSTLLALKGTPLKTTPMRGTEAATYQFDGLTVGAHDEVYWIVATDPKFHTQGGVAPGAEQIFARASFGRPSCVISKDQATSYDYKGFYFEVDNSTGKVTQVGVRPKSQTCKS